MNVLLALTWLYFFQNVVIYRETLKIKNYPYCLNSCLPLNYHYYRYSNCYYFCFYFSIIDFFPQLLHLSEGVIRNIQKRFVTDRDASKRLLQSFGIIEPKRTKNKAFPDILECFRKPPGLTHLKITIKFSVGPSCLIQVVSCKPLWGCFVFSSLGFITKGWIVQMLY